MYLELLTVKIKQYKKGKASKRYLWDNFKKDKMNKQKIIINIKK